MDDLYSYVDWAGHNGSLGIWKSNTCPDTPEGQAYIEQVSLLMRKIHFFDFETRYKYDSLFSHPQANMINGTDGLGFQPFLEDNDFLYVFSEDLER